MSEPEPAIFCLLACLCTTSAHARDESHVELSAVLAVGEDLYKRAAVIVHETPKTEADVDHIFHAMGNQWQIDEHAFQTSFRPMRDATDLPGDVREAIVRIEQFDNFASTQLERRTNATTPTRTGR
jgi:phenylalanyl-tRNA synthetase beta subunit